MMRFATSLTNMKDVFDSIYKPGQPDEKRTLGSWQTDCIASREALLEIKSRLDQQEAELSEIYKADAVRDIMADSRAAFDEVVRSEKSRLTDTLDEVLDAKMNRYKSVALTAPTTEQVSLLTVLSLRDDLTESELSHIAAANAGNFQFLRSLKSIAKRSGIDLITAPTIEEVTEQLADAREYGMTSLRDICTPDSEMGYFSRCFFAGPGIGPASRFAKLDQLTFTSAQVEHEADGQNAG